MILTAGVFDLFHYGHAKMLATAAQIDPSQRLVVALNTDEFIASYKKPPIMSYWERSVVLRSISFVDEVIPNDGNFLKILKKQKPEWLVVGSDWASRDYYKQMRIKRESFERLNIKLVYVPYTEGISTTIIRERMVNG